MERLLKSLYWSVILSGVLWALGRLYMPGGIIDVLDERHRMNDAVLQEINVMKMQKER